MKYLPRFLFNCSALILVPFVANAAGTYYTGNYQSPQARYSQQSYTQRAQNTNYSNQGMSAYSRNQYANAGYTTTTRTNQNVRTTQSGGASQQGVRTSAGGNGFTLGAGLSRQVAMWQFEMDGMSILHWDNIDWNVFDVNAGYVFNAGKMQVQIGAGFKYGMQGGESTMVDDDITNGGYLYGEYVGTDVNGQPFVGEKIGHALSIGTSKDGSMMEFNAGVGLKDFFKWGNLKVTPSIGWRYLKYELQTSNNKGSDIVSADFDASCVELDDGTKQCWPLIAVLRNDENGLVPTYPGYSYFDKDGNLLTDIDGDGYLDGDAYYAAVNVSGGSFAEAEGAFYFEQPGVSHSYEVEWSGPYLGLDMQYDINQNNKVNAYLELGLPSYTATGNQPYRIDWQHPKSVEDKAGLGSAFHLGLGANWATAITDSVSLSVGVTYDYYSVGDADATTYYNPEYWGDIYTSLLNSWQEAGYTESQMLNGGVGADGQSFDADPLAVTINEIRSNGWKDTATGVIESFYKSLGVRVGINAKF